MDRDIISAKTGTSIFAYINSVFTCLFIIIVYFLVMYINILETTKVPQPFDYPASILNLLCVTLMAFAIPNLIFSITLLVGLNKNYPTYLKGYFVYGVVMMVLTFFVLTTTVLILRAGENIDDYEVIRTFGITFVFYFIYSLILVMISRARKQMLAGEIYKYKSVVET